MSDKKFRIGLGDVILLILSVFFLIGIIAIFHPCGPKDDGSWMLCHWSGNVEKGLATVIIIISVIHFFSVNSYIKLGLDFSLLPLSLFAAILPGNVIKLCMMKEMRCHTIMQPAVIIVSIFIIVAATVDILLQIKNKKTA